MIYTSLPGSSSASEPPLRSGAGRVVDLRSDTLTTPTDQMRRAMASAAVGDDVFGEDPTTNELQDRVARMFGCERALFVPSGSMGNLVSLRALAGPGDEVICHEAAHVLNYEVASLAAVAGLQGRAVPGKRGVLDPEAVRAAIHTGLYTFPRTRVIMLENTHNLAGGTIYPEDAIREIRKIADEHEIEVFMDGARLFNAAVASGVAVSEYSSMVTGLTFCFSKGLSAPVGSMVVGPKDFVERAHIFRKMHGGGMRQTGILAAACLVALDTMVDRLADDHANAKRLAQAMANLREGVAFPDNVQTNMVWLKTEPLGFDTQDFVAALDERGVRCLAYQRGRVRMVTHKDVSAEDIEYTIEQIIALARRP